jgi:hypothetical protein
MPGRPDQENPSEDKRTTADRLSDAPAVLWFILAILLVAAFAGVVFWLHRDGVAFS